MKRNLKALGLAMFAVFALSAMAASVAQATNHHLEVGTAPAIITAEDAVNEAAKFKITNGEREVTCAIAKYVGTVKETKNKEITVTPEYEDCHLIVFGSTIPVTVEHFHCAYILTGETDASGDAKTHLECSEGNEITITYSVFGSSCVVHVTPQTPAGGVHYSQSGNDVKVEITVSGIKYHETGGGFCPASTTREDGTLNGNVIAKGYKEKAGCTEQTGTARTTTTPHLTECQGEAQKLSLVTT